MKLQNQQGCKLKKHILMKENNSSAQQKNGSPWNERKYETEETSVVIIFFFSRKSLKIADRKEISKKANWPAMWKLLMCFFFFFLQIIYLISSHIKRVSQPYKMQQNLFFFSKFRFSRFLHFFKKVFFLQKRNIIMTKTTLYRKELKKEFCKKKKCL